jgi:GT2 family glycosyltransferase
MSPPLVSIITINYNEADTTAQCLDTLRHLTYPHVECLVVDNASADGEAVALQDAFPDATVISSPINLGFAGGNNLAIQRATGAYVLLLNNDTTASPGLLEPLVAALEADPQIGIASPKILFDGTADATGRHRIQYAGSSPINPYTGRSDTVGWRARDDGRFDASGPTHLAHGAAMMIRRSVFDAIGLLDERYFLYYEEHDFAARARRAGYTIHYEAQSAVYHQVSLSVGRHSPLKAHYMTRNRLLYMRRNVTGLAFLLSALIFWTLAVPKRLLGHLLRGDTDRLQAVWRGIRWHLNAADQTGPEIPTLPEKPRRALPRFATAGAPSSVRLPDANALAASQARAAS